MDDVVLADLLAEHLVLDEVLAACTSRDWDRPTPAAGWSIADTVQHLIVSEQAATRAVVEDIDPLSGTSFQSPGSLALLPDWRTARAATAQAFANRGDRDRVPWGGRRMAVRSLAIARLMETWAHGLDCLAALGLAADPTNRLRHVAWLGHRTLPHAFAGASVTPPGDPQQVRVELSSPAGDSSWNFGPTESGDRITGPALDWCRLVTHRLRPGDPFRLRAEGPLAQAALIRARAFL